MISLGAYSFLSTIASADEGRVVRSVNPGDSDRGQHMVAREIERLLCASP